MRNNIIQMVDSCKECQRTRPAQPEAPMMASAPSASKGAPFEHIGTDLFQFGGHQHLLVVDRFRGYPLVKKLKSTDTKTIISVMSEWFNM